MKKEFELSLQGLVEIKDYDRSFVWIDENENIINECIDELSESILQYSKTGYRNNTLTKFSDNHEGLNELYRSCIKKNIKFDENGNGNTVIVKENTRENNYKYKELLSKQFKGLSYLSFLESIYNIYVKEKTRRDLWSEFDSKINDTDFLLTIEEISDKDINKNILTSSMLAKKVEKLKVERCLEKNSDYFLFTPNKQEYNVALSSKGKSFCDYLKHKKKIYNEAEIEKMFYIYTEYLLGMVELGVDECKQKEVEISVDNNEIMKKFQPKIKNIIKRKILRTCKRIRNKQKGLQICIGDCDEFYDTNKINEKYSISYIGGNGDGYYQRA